MSWSTPRATRFVVGYTTGWMAASWQAVLRALLRDADGWVRHVRLRHVERSPQPFWLAVITLVASPAKPTLEGVAGQLAVTCAAQGLHCFAARSMAVRAVEHPAFAGVSYFVGTAVLDPGLRHLASLHLPALTVFAPLAAVTPHLCVATNRLAAVVDWSGEAGRVRANLCAAELDGSGVAGRVWADLCAAEKALIAARVLLGPASFPGEQMALYTALHFGLDHAIQRVTQALTALPVENLPAADHVDRMAEWRRTFLAA